MHAPASLDLERSSWSSVVYLNIVKSIRILLEALDGAGAAPGATQPRSEQDGDSWRHQLANLRLRLSPLVGVEANLATRLSGGVGMTVGDGKGGVFVRRGWQCQVKSGPVPPRSHAARIPNISDPPNPMDDPIARMLDASKVGGCDVY